MSDVGCSQTDSLCLMGMRGRGSSALTHVSVFLPSATSVMQAVLATRVFLWLGSQNESTDR